VTHQTSWLESTGVSGVQQELACTAEVLEPRRRFMASMECLRGSHQRMLAHGLRYHLPSRLLGQRVALV